MDYAVFTKLEESFSRFYKNIAFRNRFIKAKKSETNFVEESEQFALVLNKVPCFTKSTA